VLPFKHGDHFLVIFIEKNNQLDRQDEQNFGKNRRNRGRSEYTLSNATPRHIT
jgi:hypothetical protein